MVNSDTPILIFGSFNPPTKAHVRMSEVLHRIYPTCEIVYVPAKDRYLKGDWKKQDKILDIDTRAFLLRRCVDLSYAHVSTIEYALSGDTYDTVKYYANYTKYLEIALGADNLQRMNEWHKWKELVRENRFIIFTRDNNDLPKFLQPYKDHFTFIPFNMDEYSSTRVREAIKDKEWITVRKLVPTYIYKYLKEYNIWK